MTAGLPWADARISRYAAAELVRRSRCSHVKGEGATYVTRTAARATSGCPLTMTLPLRDQLLVDCAVAHGI